MQKLEAATVAVIGLGGVGSWAAEALARSGVGSFILVDDDKVCLTNCNRQAIALHSTVGRYKTDVMRERISDINPRARITVFPELYNEDSAERIINSNLCYVVDAIDMVSAKIHLIMHCAALELPVISTMGTGNKLDPEKLKLGDIYDTDTCPLARVMRRELRNRGIRSLSVVHSTEPPILISEKENPCRTSCICPSKERTCVERRSVPGSVSFVPGSAGLLIASRIVRRISGFDADASAEKDIPKLRPTLCPKQPENI